jgi:hypothetical protein
MTLDQESLGSTPSGAAKRWKMEDVPLSGIPTKVVRKWKTERTSKQ